MEVMGRPLGAIAPQAASDHHQQLPAATLQGALAGPERGAHDPCLVGQQGRDNASAQR